MLGSSVEKRFSITSLGIPLPLIQMTIAYGYDTFLGMRPANRNVDNDNQVLLAHTLIDTGSKRGVFHLRSFCLPQLLREIQFEYGFELEQVSW